MRPLFETAMDMSALPLVLIGVAAFVAVLALWSVVGPADRIHDRVAAVSARRPDRQVLRAAAATSVGRTGSGPLARAAIRLRLVQVSQSEKVRLKLLRAGHPGRQELVAYLLVKSALPLAVAGVTAALVLGLDVWSLPSHLKPLTIVVAAVVALYLPDMYLARVTRTRERAVLKALPDGLDLLVICAEAGLSLDAALNRVAAELAGSAPALASELATTAAELSLLPERRQALSNLARRCAIAPVRGAVNTLQQTERYGTPLAQSLRVLSAEFREQRMLRAEAKAARLPAILTVPMIVFILPTLFVVLAGPAMLAVYDSIIKQ